MRHYEAARNDMARGIISFVARNLVCCHFSQGLRAAESCLAVLHICLRLKRLCQAAALCLPLLAPPLSLSAFLSWCNCNVAQFAFRMCFNLFHFISCTFLFICGMLQFPRGCNPLSVSLSTSLFLSLSLFLPLPLPVAVTVFHMSGCHIFSFLARLPTAIAAQFSLLASLPSTISLSFSLRCVLTLSHHHCRRDAS